MYGMTTATADPVAAAVRVLAAWQDTSPTAVGTAIGIAPRTWKRRMTSGDWSLAELRRLATYFGVPESVLLGGPASLFREEVVAYHGTTDRSSARNPLAWLPEMTNAA